MQKLPDTDVLPSFKPVITELYDRLSRLALRVLELMGHGLKLKASLTGHGGQTGLTGG